MKRNKRRLIILMSGLFFVGMYQMEAALRQTVGPVGRAAKSEAGVLSSRSLLKTPPPARGMSSTSAVLSNQPLRYRGWFAGTDAASDSLTQRASSNAFQSSRQQNLLGTSQAPNTSRVEEERAAALFQAAVKSGSLKAAKQFVTPTAATRPGLRPRVPGNIGRRMMSSATGTAALSQQEKELARSHKFRTTLSSMSFVEKRQFDILNNVIKKTLEGSLNEGPLMRSFENRIMAKSKPTIAEIFMDVINLDPSELDAAKNNAVALGIINMSEPLTAEVLNNRFAELAQEWNREAEEYAQVKAEGTKNFENYLQNPKNVYAREIFARVFEMMSDNPVAQQTLRDQTTEAYGKTDDSLLTLRETIGTFFRLVAASQVSTDALSNLQLLFDRAKGGGSGSSSFSVRIPSKAELVNMGPSQFEKEVNYLAGVMEGAIRTVDGQVLSEGEKAQKLEFLRSGKHPPIQQSTGEALPSIGWE